TFLGNSRTERFAAPDECESEWLRFSASPDPSRGGRPATSALRLGARDLSGPIIGLQPIAPFVTCAFGFDLFHEKGEEACSHPVPAGSESGAEPRRQDGHCEHDRRSRRSRSVGVPVETLKLISHICQPPLAMK